MGICEHFYSCQADSELQPWLQALLQKPYLNSSQPWIKKVSIANTQHLPNGMQLTQQNGVGVIYSSQYFYCGQVRDKKADGEGRQTIKTGQSSQAQYVGEFKGNARNGRGCYLDNENEICFDGLWKDGHPVKGTLKSNKKTIEILKLSFEDEQWCRGRITANLENDARYKGEFTRGENNQYYFEGNGELNFADGSSYRGEFRWGAMEGRGVYQWANGHEYEGSFRKGVKHGTGKYKFERTKYLSGTWNEGKKEGKFQLFYFSAEGAEPRKGGDLVFKGDINVTKSSIICD